MSCKKTFSYDFLSNNCTSVFITKELKSHREDILFDREKSLLPETQPHVIVELEKRNLKKQIDSFHERIFELRRQERILNNQINDLTFNMNRLNVNNVGEGTTVEERKKFIRKCPMGDCRGFLSTQWKCGSCEKRICNRCNEEKVTGPDGTEHRCLPENVASMELLNKDTKPCPNCGTMIFRISGCSQMFCTDCHTPWDWNTERVVTGVIHNPHYYELVNRNGTGARNHADIPCGGLPDGYDMRNMMSRLFNNNPPQYIFNIYQCVMHIQHHELRNHIVEDVVVTNRSLRIKYLLNEITDAGFKAVLQQAEKKRQKAIAFRNIYQMFVDVASDIFRQMYVSYSENRLRTPGVAIEFVRSNVIILNNLVEYFNENLQKIGKMYKCVYPGITPERIFTNNLASYKARQAPQVEIHHIN